MEKRVLRSRARKVIEKENVQPQPAKRNRRAISTIECRTQLKMAHTVETAKIFNASTQTDDCLISTIEQLTQELITKSNQLHQKDQKYIEMMQKYYLERERLREENRDKTLEIAQLKERLDHLQSVPLVQIEVNGKAHTIKN